jgi:hypothetical protein
MSWIIDQNQVHMTIGSFMHTRDDISQFHNDLEMVKAALLYADRSKLVSVQTHTLLDMNAERDLRKYDPITHLKNTLLSAPNEEVKKTIRESIQMFERAKRRRYSKKGREEFRLLTQWFESHLQTILDRWAMMRSEPAAQELLAAINSGFLEIHPFQSVFDRVTQGTVSGEILAREYFLAVAAAATDNQTYPLFDERTSGMISLKIGSGDLGISSVANQRGKEIALAADLLARLPLFERASVKEILDIRRELEKPLAHFRSSMIKFSDQIQSASWDKDFVRDADQVFRSEVAPAVLALEEEEKSNSFLSKLTAKVADKSLQVGGAVTASGAISALAVRMLNLPLADVAALAVGPAIVAGGVAYTAYTEWKDKQKEIEGNSLFFYYKAGSLLEDGSFRYQDTNVQG